MAALFQASYAGFLDMGSDGWREEPHWGGGEVSLKNPAQIAERLPDDQGIGVLVPKPRGGHSPWLDVRVAVTFGNDQDHPAAEGTMVLVLPAVVPWAIQNTKTLQGIDQKAGRPGAAWQMPWVHSSSAI